MAIDSLVIFGIGCVIVLNTLFNLAIFVGGIWIGTHLAKEEEG